MTNNRGFTRIPPIGHRFSVKGGKGSTTRNYEVISNNQEESRGFVFVKDLLTGELFPCPIDEIPGYGKVNLNFGVSSSKNEEVKSPPLWGFSGSKLFLSRYGLIRKENLSFFERIGNILERNNQPNGRPYIRGYEYYSKPIRNGYVYIYEKLSLTEDKSKISEYKVTNGQLSENLWTKEAKDKKLDIREPKKVNDLNDFHLIDDGSDEVWIAFSDIQWSFEYATNTFKDTAFMEERFTRLSMGSWYSDYDSGKETKDASLFSLSGGLPYYAAAWHIEKKSQCLDRISSYWEQDKNITIKNATNENEGNQNLTVYLSVDDPVGCAFDVIEDLDSLYNQLNAYIISMSSSKNYEEALEALENGEEIQIDYSSKKEMQYNSMFMTAISIFNLLYEQSGSDMDDCRKAIQTDKLLKLLAVNERQKIRDQILGKNSLPSVRDALGEILSSNYYQNVLNDYYFNTNENVADGESIVILQHYKLKMLPHYIDNLLNVTRDKVRMMSDKDSKMDLKDMVSEKFVDKWDDFLYNSFYAKVAETLDKPLYAYKSGKSISLTPYLYKKKIITPEMVFQDKFYKLAIKCALNANTAFSVYSNYLTSHIRAAADDFLLWEQKYHQLVDGIQVREVEEIAAVNKAFEKWEKEFYPDSKASPVKKVWWKRVPRFVKEKINKNFKKGQIEAQIADRDAKINDIKNKSQIEIDELKKENIVRKGKIFEMNKNSKTNWGHKIFKSAAFRKMIVGLNAFNFGVAVIAEWKDPGSPRNILSFLGSGTNLSSVILRFRAEEAKLAAELTEEVTIATSVQNYVSRGSTFTQRALGQPIYTKLGWGGSAIMIIVSGIDAADRFSANDTDAGWAYVAATVLSVGSLGVSVYLVTAAAAAGWVPVVGWILLAAGLITTGLAIWLTDTPLEAFLKNSVFGKNKEIEGIADWSPDRVKSELYRYRTVYANKKSITFTDMEDMEAMFEWLHDLLTNFRFDICKDYKPLINDKNVKIGVESLKYCYGFNVGFEFNGAIPGKSTLEYHLQIYPYGMDRKEAMFETVEFKNKDGVIITSQQISPIQVQKTLFVPDKTKGCITGNISFRFGDKLFELNQRGNKKAALFSGEMIAVFYCRLVIDRDNSLYWPYQGDDDNIYAASFALLTCPKSKSAYFNQALIQSGIKIGPIESILDEAAIFQNSYTKKFFKR